MVALSEGMSDRLLALEEATFAVIDDAFAVAAVTASDLMERTARRAAGDGPRFASDADMRRGLLVLHAAAMADCSPAVAALAEMATDEALTSIADELVLCERTLAAKHRGIASEAVEAARGTETDVVTSGMAYYGTAETAGQAAFEQQMVTQLTTGATVGEGPEQIAQRILSREVLTRKGIGGRGVWWRTVSGLQMAARGVSIGLSNGARGNAMLAMNDAAARR